MEVESGPRVARARTLVPHVVRTGTPVPCVARSGMLVFEVPTIGGRVGRSRDYKTECKRGVQIVRKGGMGAGWRGKWEGLIEDDMSGDQQVAGEEMEALVPLCSKE
jgi:hypothetical protein